MKQRLSLLLAHLRVCIAEDKTDGSEEVALARSISADNNVVFGREGLDDRLVLIAVDPSA